MWCVVSTLAGCGQVTRRGAPYVVTCCASSSRGSVSGGQRHGRSTASRSDTPACCVSQSYKPAAGRMQGLHVGTAGDRVTHTPVLTPPAGQVLDGPAAAWPGLLPRQRHPAPRPQGLQPADQQVLPAHTHTHTHARLALTCSLRLHALVRVCCACAGPRHTCTCMPAQQLAHVQAARLPDMQPCPEAV